MSEKTKKWLVLAGLSALCVVLAVGIRMRLYKEDIPEDDFSIKSEQNQTEDMEQNIAKNPTTAPEPSRGTEPTDVPEPTGEAEPTEKAKPTEEAKPTEAPIIDIGGINPDDVQELQPKQEKEQIPMPTGTPELAEGTDLTDPTKKPAYQEETTIVEAKKPADEEEPKMGDIKDGYMYVLGFGWVPYEGEGHGTYADDMYENGNKIGIMD